MYLNTILPGLNSKFYPKRLGRGIGSGLGKTCGRGHKGQKSRSGGKISFRFEGGQTPLYRRLPKFGFKSRKCVMKSEVNLSVLNTLHTNIVNLENLKSANIISNKIVFVKIICSGKITKNVIVNGLKVSRNARIAIEKVGGKVEDF